MPVELLTEHHLEFLSLKRDCRGSSESTFAGCQVSYIFLYLEDSPIYSCIFLYLEDSPICSYIFLYLEDSPIYSYISG